MSFRRKTGLPFSCLKAHFPMLMIDEDNPTLLVVDGDYDLLLDAVLHPLVGVGVLRRKELRAQRRLSYSRTTQHHHPDQFEFGQFCKDDKW